MVVAFAAALVPWSVQAAADTAPRRAVAAVQGNPSPIPSDRPNTKRRKDPAAFRQAKLAADARAAAAAPSSGTAPQAPSAATGAARVYNGNNFAGLNASSFTPSDSTGDASSTQQVEMVNSELAVFPIPCPACGAAVGNLTALVGANRFDCVFDPQIAWDGQWGRWIYAMAVQTSSTGGCHGDQNGGITNDRLVLGWTYTADANDLIKGNFCWNEIDHGANLDDSPKLGHDDNSIVVAANVMANYGQGSFLNSEVWVFKKPSGVSATNGCGIGFSFTKTSLGSSVFSPVPADMTDSSPVDYIVASQQPGNGPASNLLVWQSSASSGVTSIGAFGVAGYNMPPDVPQPSTGTAACGTAGTCLDSGDSSLTQAVGHYDPAAGAETLWTQHAITDPRVGARSVERWYEIVPGARTVRQSGNISDPNLYIFNGAVSPTAAGDEAIAFYNAGSGASDGFVSWRSQGRNRLTALGTMTGETVLATSAASDSDFTCGVNQSPANSNSCRWGDYSGARPDPGNANGVWGFGMLTGSGGIGTSPSWSTQVSEVTPGCVALQLYTNPLGGGRVQFTAGAPGGGPTQGIAPPAGCSTPTYQFYLQAPGGSWTVAQAWSSSSSWTWDTSGYRPGTYNIDAWANQAGDSTANAESFALTQWSIPSCSSASVTSNTMSPQPSGAQVVISASSSCPNPNPEYQLWLLPPGGPWTIAQPYSTNATYNWDTSGLAPGNYHFSLWVRDASSSGAFGTPPYTYDAYAAYDFALQPAPCTGMNTSTSPPTSATVGTFVTVTGSASGCPKPLYEFWLLPPGGTWQLVRPYSSKTTLGWDTRGWPQGSYRFSVWARDASSSSSYDAFSAFQYPLTISSCTAMSATPPPGSSASVGTPVTVTGTATGCPNPQYEFWLLAPGRTWALAQPYSGTATFNWNTSGSAAGTYRFSVWARDASSAASYDAFSAFDFTLTITPCTGMSASVSPTNSAPSGTTITITGNATGCANAQYEIWVLPPGGTWMLLRGYTSSNTFMWNTPGQPAGPYRFSVWARDASSSGTNGSAPYTYDAFSAFQYTLT